MRRSVVAVIAAGVVVGLGLDAGGIALVVRASLGGPLSSGGSLGTASAIPPTEIGGVRSFGYDPVPLHVTASVRDGGGRSVEVLGASFAAPAGFDSAVRPAGPTTWAPQTGTGPGGGFPLSLGAGDTVVIDFPLRWPTCDLTATGLGQGGQQIFSQVQVRYRRWGETRVQWVPLAVPVAFTGGDQCP